MNPRHFVPIVLSILFLTGCAGLGDSLLGALPTAIWIGAIPHCEKIEDAWDREACQLGVAAAASEVAWVDHQESRPLCERAHRDAGALAVHACTHPGNTDPVNVSSCKMAAVGVVLFAIQETCPEAAPPLVSAP